MPLWPQFVGGSYRARSASIAADACINLYPETTEIAGEAKKSTLYGTPGLKLLATFSTSGCRGCFEQDGRVFVVFGGTLYEFDPINIIITNRGAIANDGLPVSMVSNGRGGEQLLICGGGQVKIFTLTTNVLSASVTLPLTNPPVMAAFLDGYFLLLEQNTIRVWFSNLENGLIWNALNFFSRSTTSDNLVGMIVVRDRIWLFGSQTTVLYYDSGNATTPFVVYPGAVILEGAVTPWAISILGEKPVWLAHDTQGGGRIVTVDGYTPRALSTPAIGFALASYPTLSDMEVLAYEGEGHPFIAFTSPSGDQTFVWDEREQQWHERSWRDDNTGSDHRWRARGLCASGQLLITGDYATGELYTLDLNTAQDNGATLRRVRRAPYISTENQWTFLDRFELGIQSGVGVGSGQGATPQLMLRLSRDSGATWTPPLLASMGAVGGYLARAVWRKLGRVRADRLVVEVSQTDPVRSVWGPGAWVKATPGSGAL